MPSLLVAIVAAPGLCFLFLALIWLLGFTPSERNITRLSKFVALMASVGSLSLAGAMWWNGTARLSASLGNWMHAGHYAFPVVLVLDWVSLPLFVLTVLLSAVITAFSSRYMHRERGFYRFFLLLNLFTFGALIAFTAESFDFLLAGWELVGITSVLLIAFFDERPEPVRNAVRIFAVYRLADVGLLLGIFWMHYSFGTANFGQLPSQARTGETALGLLLLLAASGKSSQYPLFGWLPRAMEGPTPSSAIFYGAISVHLGAYLLLRAMPIFAHAPIAAAAVVGVGLITAVTATLAHRTATDAKSSLAYAAMAQMGLIFAEIGFGWQQLALLHMLGHATLRTTQFLRAPSVLHEYRRIRAANGGDLDRTGKHYERLLPEGLRLALYRLSLERGYFENALERGLVRPALSLADWAASFEPGMRSEKRLNTREVATVPQPWQESMKRMES